VVEDSTTQRILDAALDLFSESGYGSATVDDIARRAGVGVATLYRRWDDKPALANTVYRSALNDMAPLYDELSGPTPKKRFMELWHRVSTYAEDHPEAFLFVENHIHAAFVDVKSAKAKANVAASGVELLETISANQLLK